MVAVLKAFGKLLSRVFGLFLGGWYTWIGITTYVVYENRRGFQILLESWNPVPLLVSFGTKLGQADQIILNKTLFILQLQAAPTKYAISIFGAEIFTFQSGAIAYLTALAAVLGSLAYILWYFKAFQKGSELILAGNAPFVYTMPIAFAFYGMTILLVRNGVPFEGVQVLIQNLETVFDWERFNPLGESSMNQSMNTTPEAVKKQFP